MATEDRKQVRLAVGMAAIPQRRHVFPEVVAAILQQTMPPDEVHIALNGYGAVPGDFPRDPCIRYRVTGERNLGDLEKFFPLERPVAGRAEYIATVDDDILYPSDYFECLVRWSRHFGDRVVIGVHGRTLLKLPCRRFYGNRLHHCRKILRRPCQVHVLGTGTMLTHRVLVGEDFHRPWDTDFVNRGDILMAVGFSRRGVPKVAVPRGGCWLRDTPAAFRSGTQGQSRETYLQGTTKLVNRYVHLLAGDAGRPVPHGVVALQSAKLRGPAVVVTSSPNGLRVRSVPVTVPPRKVRL